MQIGNAGVRTTPLKPMHQPSEAMPAEPAQSKSNVTQEGA